MASKTHDRSSGGALAREDVFEVLSNERRRYALDYLKQHVDRRVDLRELVEYVAIQESNIDPDALDYGHRKSVYTALRQTHLPKLSESGMVEYDSECGEVELTEAAQRMEFHLECVPAYDIPWALCYLGLVGVVGAIATLSWASVFPFVELTGMAITAISIAVFGLSATIHTVHTHRNKLGREDDGP